MSRNEVSYVAYLFKLWQLNLRTAMAELNEECSSALETQIVIMRIAVLLQRALGGR